LQGVFCINCCIFGSPYLCNTYFTLIINAFVLFFVILSCLSIILYSTVVLSLYYVSKNVSRSLSTTDSIGSIQSRKYVARLEVRSGRPSICLHIFS
jgi:hypothetical protein